MAVDPHSTGAETSPLDIDSPAYERASTRTPARTLRLGNLTMDARTGATRWSGALLSLGTEERELLAELLRHAGQVLSPDALAKRLRIRRDLVDARVRRLVHILQEQGVRPTPRTVDGLGYLLWR